MKKLLLLSLLLGLASCASSKADRSPSAVTLIRAGGFSGLENRFRIEANGHATKSMRFPKQDEKTVADTMLSANTVAPIFSYLDRNLDTLLTLKLDETGNMTTTLILHYGAQSHMLRWPNLEPPILATKKLDSLYNYVAPVEEWLSATQ
ncbi:MAG TPA: hypothetical protein VFH43_14520 [Candidatus Kapabacteria bacterium]|nr:hypothetical protein [Candidatus Kapabacteria bacterium]